MQPQDAGDGFNWIHAVTAIFSGAFGAVSGFAVSIWRVARIEPTIRMDFEAGLKESEERMGMRINTAEKQAENKLDGLVEQFHESFAGLRQKINNVELGTEKNFLSKGEFEQWRREDREDKHRILEKLDNLLSRH